LDVLPALGNGDCLFICLFYAGYLLMRGGAADLNHLALREAGVTGGRIIRILYRDYIRSHAETLDHGLQDCVGDSNGNPVMSAITDTLKDTVRLDVDPRFYPTVLARNTAYENILNGYPHQTHYGGNVEMMILCALVPGLRIHVILDTVALDGSTEKYYGAGGVILAEPDGAPTVPVHTIRLSKTGTGASSHFDLFKWRKPRSRTKQCSSSAHKNNSPITRSHAKVAGAPVTNKAADGEKSSGGRLVR
jgi:hypothetical protein